MLRKNYQHLSSVLVFSVFLLYFLIGLAVFRDYSISWDEEAYREYGHIVFSYISGNRVVPPNPTLRDLSSIDVDDYMTGKSAKIDAVRFSNTRTNVLYDAAVVKNIPIDNLRFYGPAYQILLVVLEKISGFTSVRNIYFLRHLVTSLLFFSATIVFYLILRMRYRDWKLPLIGVVFFMLTPRLFAERFYNAQDIPFLCMFIFAVYTLLRFIQKPSVGRVLFHGFVCAVLVDIRIAGLLIIVLSTSVYILNIFFDSGQKRNIRFHISALSLYITSWFAFTVLFWPTLWSNPLGNFIKAFEEMKQFPWNGTMLYMGKYIAIAPGMPWHYSLVWIGITTPIAYTVLFVIGVCALLYQFPFMRQKWQQYRIDILFFLWFAIPIFLLIVLRSVVYDGWRHLYFLYPAFLAIAVGGLCVLLEWIKKRRIAHRRVFTVILVACIGLNLLRVVSFMVTYHPYQNLYFSAWAGGMEKVKKNFEMDYWGLTYRKGLEFLARNAPNPPVRVVTANVSQAWNILAPEDRKNLIQVNKAEDAQYYVSTYRWHNEDFELPEFYSYPIQGTKVLVILKQF